MLVFLEDTSLLAEQVQQSKLAALGRLSASIAHEIRNPVGAMSHAGQLLGESPTLAAEDRRLTEIIRSNAERVSGIIDNVLRLSRREETHARAPVAAGLASKSSTTNSARPCSGRASGCRRRGPAPDVEVRADPSQLRQIVWNLCENALKHGVRDEPRAGASRSATAA